MFAKTFNILIWVYLSIFQVAELDEYIGIRGGELCADEVLRAVDVSENPQIDHIVYENGQWEMWDREGKCFKFKKRDW